MYTVLPPEADVRHADLHHSVINRGRAFPEVTSERFSQGCHESNEALTGRSFQVQGQAVCFIFQAAENQSHPGRNRAYPPSGPERPEWIREQSVPWDLSQNHRRSGFPLQVHEAFRGVFRHYKGKYALLAFVFCQGRRIECYSQTALLSKHWSIYRTSSQ